MPDELIEAVDMPAPVSRGADDSGEMTMTEFADWWRTSIGSVSLQSALQQAAFLLCCDVIAQDMAKARLQLRQLLPNGTSRIVMPEEHRIAHLLADGPNRRHTWFEFVEMMGLWHASTSNSYAVVFRTVAGDPVEIVPVQTGRVQEKVIGRETFYDVTAGTMQEQALLGAGFMTVPERDMIHVRGRMLDGMDGYSTMTAGRSTLEAGKAIDDYRENLFSEEGQLRGVFTRDANLGVLPDEAFTRFRQQFKELMSRFRKNTAPVVLEGGIKFDAIASNPADAELSKQFEAQIVQTCRLFRMPPHKVFAMSGVKYENLETLEKSYVGDTLIPICERHEQRYGKILLTSRERARYFIQHDREAMTIRDTKAETERVVRLVERGVIEIDEARARMNYNPLENGAGQVRLVPGNMIVVDRHNEVLIGAQAQAGKTEEQPEVEDADPAPDEAASDRKMLRLVAENR